MYMKKKKEKEMYILFLLINIIMLYRNRLLYRHLWLLQPMCVCVCF